jgi:hypothetical protein
VLHVEDLLLLMGDRVRDHFALQIKIYKKINKVIFFYLVKCFSLSSYVGIISVDGLISVNERVKFLNVVVAAVVA